MNKNYKNIMIYNNIGCEADIEDNVQYESQFNKLKKLKKLKRLKRLNIDIIEVLISKLLINKN